MDVRLKAEKLMKESLYLHVPTYEELWYRRKIMQDPDTMSYNKGYDLDFDGYDKATGCIAFPEQQWTDWYHYFIGQEPLRFFAYIVRESDGKFIGEVNVHMNTDAGWYEMGIVLEAKYRGKGYAVAALQLLLQHAFEKMDANAVHNNFEEERSAAVQTHLTVGFTKYRQENGILELLITREQYFQQKALRRCALDYRRADINDLNAIIAVIQDAIITMEKNNIYQWDELYPTKDIIQKDIESGHLYIGMADKNIAVIFVLNQECDDEYRNGNWAHPDREYFVIHRLCVNPLYQNRGVAKRTMLFIEEQVTAMNIFALRLDVFSENPYAIKLYEDMGYSKTGHADWRKGRFYLMEKYIGEGDANE